MPKQVAVKKTQQIDADFPGIVIIEDANKIEALQILFEHDLERINDIKHVLAVSTMCKAAKDGNPVLLNRFYNSLPVNDQTSFRQWVARTMRNGTDSQGVVHTGSGTWIKFVSLEMVEQKKVPEGMKFGWNVIQGKMDERVNWQGLAHAELIVAPPVMRRHNDGEPAPWARFYQRENIAERDNQRKWDDDGVIKGLQRILKNEENENGTFAKVNVSPQVHKIIEQAIEAAKQAAATARQKPSTVSASKNGEGNIRDTVEPKARRLAA